MEKCGCENESHFDGTRHEYLKAVAGETTFLFVGAICDNCAETCMVEYRTF